MKKFSQKNQVPSFNFNLFERTQLAEVGGAERANINLAHVIYGGGQILQAIDDLFGKDLFEFVFSIASDDVTDKLHIFMLDNFPKTAAEFDASHYATTLPRLASYLYFLPREDEEPRVSANNYQVANSVPGVLKALSSAFPEGQTELGDAVKKDNDENGSELGRKKQHQIKQSKKMYNRAPISNPGLDRAIRKLGKCAPTTREEADNLTDELLCEMKGLLTYFLDSLRDPATASIIRDSYMQAPVTPQVGAPNVNEATVPNEVVEMAAAETTSAFSGVQPLKAALHFDNVKGFGNWQVFLSTKAEKHLREHRKNMKTLKIIVEKIKELSQGHFSDDNQKRLRGPDNGIPIFEAKMTGDLHLVYQIDCLLNYDTDVEWQVLRLFGVFSHAQMDYRMWESLSAQLAKKGPEYRRRVIARSRPVRPNDNVFEPLSWPDGSTVEDETSDHASLNSLIRPSDLSEIHQWLVLEKYAAFSQALWNCILTDKASTAIFTVSPNERAIIENTSSCFVIGRSGTGKTTTMVFKMFGIERLARSLPKDDRKKPRQLFVTQSKVLAERVESYFDKLTDFLNTASVSVAELKEIEDSHREAEEVDDLVDPEDDEEWRNDLPKCFSDLEEKHFPLFLTFDKLCRLLEADLGSVFKHQRYTRERKQVEGHCSVNNSDILDDPEALDGNDLFSQARSNEQWRSSFVTFDAFCTRYWPHFPQNLTKGLDMSLVFNEFLGVIKGSEECFVSEKPCLSRETYLRLSHRAYYTFATQRDRIYDLFEFYQRLKQQYKDYDTADRSHAIVRSLNGLQHMHSVDYLYIDEAQDNLIVDALLLRSLCQNPHGLFWAGDTAQTIAVGSSFRFDDLKASLHRFEAALSQQPCVKPNSFQLTTNYRSHSGIVNCAEMVIRLIEHFWPHSIDVLRQEKGLVDGEKPVIMTGWNDLNALYEQFLLGESGDRIEFGARQCILVRNSQARDDLRAQIGNIGVILTLYESKGLEFDDVLLFNFFEDSPCDTSQWRVVLNYETDSVSYGVKPPKFDELKFLYVAMTRARKNLWIIDRSEKVEPMKLLLNANHRVRICSSDPIPRLSVTSTSEEWRKTARDLFQHQRYSQAMHCFEHAGLDFERFVAEAFSLRQHARTIRRGIHDKERKCAFSRAGAAFNACAQVSPIRSKKYLYSKAGDCFQEAEDFRTAVRAYSHAEEYIRSALSFRKAGMFDEAVAVIVGNWEKVDQVEAKKIIDVAKFHYLCEDEIEKAKNLFDSVDDALDFTEHFELNKARRQLLISVNRNVEAAELYLSEGQQVKAIRLLMSKSEDERCLQRVAQLILDQLWKTYAFISLSTNCINRDVDCETPFDTLKSSSRVSIEIRKELEMFFSVKNRDLNNLFSLQNDFFHEGDRLHATFVLNHYLRISKGITYDSAEKFLPVLEASVRYAELIRSLWEMGDIAHTKEMQKLLGFRPKPDLAEFAVDKQSVLYSYAMQHGLHRRLVTSEMIVQEVNMPKLIKDSLVSHLHEFTRVQNERMLKGRDRLFGTPCLIYATRGKCYRSDCWREHIDASTIDSRWFNLRIRLHYLQILLLHHADFSLECSERRKWRRVWLTNLFEIFHPAILEFGSSMNILSTSIPETRIATQIILQWLADVSYSLTAMSSRQVFLNEAMEVMILGMHYDASQFQQIIYHSPFYDRSKASPSLLRQHDAVQQYIIHDLLFIIDTSRPHFLLRGICLVKHVIDKGLQIAADHLCWLMERICSYLIVIHVYQRRQLHICSLPRSWFQFVLQKLNLEERSDLQYSVLRLAWQFVDVLFDVLRRLLSLSNTSSANPNLLNASNSVRRNLSIARLCRCAVLLGYNFNRDLQGTVVARFSQVRDDFSSLPWPVKQYVFRKSWKELAGIVHCCVLNTKLDCMVQLVRKGNNTIPLARNSTIVRVEFVKLLDIMPALTHEDFPPFQLSGTVQPFVPRKVLTPQAPELTDHTMPGGFIMETDVENHQMEDEVGNDGSVVGDDGEENSEMVDITIDQDAEIMPEVEAPVIAAFSDEDLALVKKMQTRYKSVICRRTIPVNMTKRRKEMVFSFNHLYSECLKLSAEMRWTSRRQRIMYLGLLPHILMCLGAVLKKLNADRKRAQDAIKGVTKEAHAEYENLMQRMTQTRERRKRLETLRKLFEPKSDWHVRRDFAELQDKFREIEILISELGLNDEYEIGENLSLAKKAILQQRKVINQEPQPRPELNTEDVYDFEDY